MLLIPEAAGDGEEERSPEICRVKLGHHRRHSSYSYQRLHEPSLLILSVLKLDGSVFDIQVARSANVWELKVAVERFFFPILKDEGINVSWSHVWSHFCLCYKNQKLTDDKATLKSLGIRYGDQLSFVQHLSVDYLSKNKSKTRQKLEQRRSSISAPLEILTEEEKGKIAIHNTQLRRSNSFGDVGIYEIALGDEAENSNERDCFKSGVFFRGWFSYSRLKSSTIKKKTPNNKRRE